MSDKLVTVLEYSTLYPGESEPDVNEVLQHLSRNSIVNLVLVLTELYNNGDLSLIPHFFQDTRIQRDVIQRIIKYRNPQIEYIILPLQTVLRLFQKAVSLPKVEADKVTPDLELQLFKAILYINEQEMKSYHIPDGAAEMIFIQSLITYTSSVTPNQYKVRTFLQTYSACKFFKVIESRVQTDVALKTIYDAFLNKYGIRDWQEYVRTLFGILAMSKWKVGKIPHDFRNDQDAILNRTLVETLTLDLDIVCADTATSGRNNNVDYRTFRDKPFIYDAEGNHVVYWMEALIDRIYNSIYFDFGDINRQLNLHYPIPQLFTNDFAEKSLFQDLMSRTNMQSRYTAYYNDEEHGKADYVLRHDNIAILFECKDIKILGDILETHDGDEIMSEYRNKLYMEIYVTYSGQKEYHEHPKPKGVGQLINYINQARNGDPYYGGTNQDSMIYPVLIVGDYKILQRGFQQIADKWFEERGVKNHNDKPLIVMSFITLMKSYPLFSKNGFEHYFDAYRNFINSIANPADLRKYITFDDYMQDYGEEMDIPEIREEFDATLNYQ